MAKPAIWRSPKWGPRRSRSGSCGGASPGRARDLRASVARIVTADGKTAGTGFLLSGGLLATAAHVAEAAGGSETTGIELALRAAPGPLVHADPKGWTSPDGLDLALFRISEDDLPAKVVPLALGSRTVWGASRR